LKRIIRFLRRSIISDPHLWIAFTAAFILLLMDLLHVFKLLARAVPHEGLLIVITFCIMTLLVDRLREGEQIREQVQENAEKLGRIANSVFDKRIALRSRPSTPEEYAYLWGGYTGMYYVYNPSYQVDKYTDEDEIVKIFIHRYQNPHFEKARYIFLTKDDSGKADLETFRRLMVRVKQAYPDVAKKLRVKEVKNKESYSASEMYLGIRYGERRGVMELKEPALGSQHGMPHYYLVIDDKEVVEHYLKDHFEPAWNDRDAEDTNIFEGE
jgi:hypothetical protein